MSNHVPHIESDSAFWAGYRKGKSDGIDGLKSAPVPPENVDSRWHADWRTGYAEGWHDGNIRHGVRA